MIRSFPMRNQFVLNPLMRLSNAPESQANSRVLIAAAGLQIALKLSQRLRANVPRDAYRVQIRWDSTRCGLKMDLSNKL